MAIKRRFGLIVQTSNGAPFSLPKTYQLLLAASLKKLSFPAEGVSQDCVKIVEFGPPAQGRLGLAGIGDYRTGISWHPALPSDFEVDARHPLAALTTSRTK